MRGIAVRAVLALAPGAGAMATEPLVSIVESWGWSEEVLEAVRQLRQRDITPYVERLRRRAARFDEKHSLDGIPAIQLLATFGDTRTLFGVIASASNNGYAASYTVARAAADGLVQAGATEYIPELVIMAQARSHSSNAAVRALAGFGLPEWVSKFAEMNRGADV